MLVKDIPREQLAPYCAKAQGWKLVQKGFMAWWEKLNGYLIETIKYDPLTNGQQVYDLIVELGVGLSKAPKSWGKGQKYTWQANILADDEMSVSSSYGTTAAEAVCRAVITSHYGEEIREEE